MGFKKPTVIAHDLKNAVKEKVGMHVPADPRRSYTDHMEFLAPTVSIGYKHYPGQNYPSVAAKTKATTAAHLAQKVAYNANKRLARVVLLRQNEPAWLSQILLDHFRLPSDGTTTGPLVDNTIDRPFSLKAIPQKDRRWFLNKLREKMLDLSYHLNTGIYMIDIDDARRDIRVGQAIAPGGHPNEEGYVGHQKLSKDPVTGRANGWRPAPAKGPGSSFKNGQIHIAFETFPGAYTNLSYARVIVHEATHRYLGTVDHFYAQDPNYFTLGLTQALENADTIAWTAISIHCKASKMTHPASTDWWQC